MEILINLSDAEEELIKNYAEHREISVSELFKTAVMERIEDEYDLSVYNAAMEEHEEDPESYSLYEVESLCDINF